jgi:hypothetical protein
MPGMVNCVEITLSLEDKDKRTQALNSGLCPWL